jgi:hypothetical protein
MKTHLYIITLFALLLAPPAAIHDAPAPKPNIVLIRSILPELGA